jgi:hypothetical protein
VLIVVLLTAIFVIRIVMGFLMAVLIRVMTAFFLVVLLVFLMARFFMARFLMARFLVVLLMARLGLLAVGLLVMLGLTLIFFLNPLRGVPLLSEALIVIALGSKQLLEVRLAICDTVHGGVVSKRKDNLAMSATQTSLVEELLLFFVFNDNLLC